MAQYNARGSSRSHDARTLSYLAELMADLGARHGDCILRFNCRGVAVCVILVNQLLTDGTRRQLTCCDQAVWDHSSE